MNMNLLSRGAEAVRDAFPRARPVGGLVLGSGWREVERIFEIRGRIDYSRIHGMGKTTVAGHDSALLLAECAGLETLVFMGHRHWYEGAGWEPVAFPAYLLKTLGASFIVLTSAAGGIRQGLEPGALMLIEDHINMMGVQPLWGEHDPFWGERFPDQSRVYDAALNLCMTGSAERVAQPLAHGVYLAVAGPVYETPAETRAFRALGADAVGMSTAPEAMLAHAAGLRVCAVSFISNRAAVSGERPLVHGEITAVVQGASHLMQRLMREFWSAVAAASV